MREFEKIVEFSFLPKYSKFVVRFLDGRNYTLETEKLPKKMQTKKPDWENAYLSGNKTSIQFRAGNEIREIPSHVIHSKGSEMI